MKKIILLLIFSLPLLGCADDNSNTPSKSTLTNDQLSNAPEAKEEYDVSNYGIYKGIFVGSSGTIYVNINNKGAISAKMVINDVTYNNFKTSEKIIEGQPIVGLTFTNGSSTFDFNVDADGENPFVDNMNISGHPNPFVQILKEYSFEQIKCYLGTFSGEKNGVYNLAIASDPKNPNNYVLGLATIKGETQAIYLDGSVSKNTINGKFQGGTFTGTIKNNTIKGSWEDETPQSGSWTAKRKL
ncbi:hypothetical protein FEDK69T_14840 [Flavobacterium enshiense DK69]|uniref:Lipoprotein n=1 Tax=Flavobacterium enshiense DK69 TaxID=1107311 RepID=V6SFY7_9FLAO|nr:hypothetical protein [Flavobacterium enshiense]ESU23325.1 hypothetical protein FEDK69T_14840 [Flavobacterium enshiense DK69]KGO96444.1 hypothetical protein Q767_05940 [Flavobacterium enshiense DK69]